MFTGLQSQTMNVSRATATPDAIGGQTLTWATVYSGKACRLCPESARDRVLAGRDAMDVHYLCFYDADVNLQAKDRIVVSGVTYLVDYAEPILGGSTVHNGEADVKVLT